MNIVFVQDLTSSRKNDPHLKEFYRKVIEGMPKSWIRTVLVTFDNNIASLRFDYKVKDGQYDSDKIIQQELNNIYFRVRKLLNYQYDIYTQCQSFLGRLILGIMRWMNFAFILTSIKITNFIWLKRLNL